MAFSRDRNSGRSGGGFKSRPSFGDRPRFNDRGDRGPVEMHGAICDNCGNSCQVPFRPTSGKPVYCSNCFEQQKGGSDSRSEERQMFSAVCADCGDNCQVPFRPSSDKLVFCSNCFGEKKNAGGNGGGKDKFEELNVKLDRILSLLSPAVESPVLEKPVKVAKKKTKVKEVVPVIESTTE